MTNIKSMKRLVLTVTVMISIAVGLGVVGISKPAPGFAQSSKTFELGILEGLSGQFSEMTRLNYNGELLAVEIMNERGGLTIKGEKYIIKPVVEDTKNTVEGAVAAANRLVYDKKLKIIAGVAMTWVVNAEVSVTDPAGVLRVQAWNNGTSTEFSAKTPLAFESSWGTLETAQACVNFLVKNYPEIKKVLVIMPDDGGIPEIGPKLNNIVKAAGLTPAGDTLGWALDTVDFNPIAQKAIARKADAWLMDPGWETIVAAFLKGAREQGFKGLLMGNQGAFHDLESVTGKDPKILTNVVMPGFSTKTVEELRALPPEMFTKFFKEVGEKAFDKWGLFIPPHIQGFQSVWNLLQAIQLAQSFDPVVIADKWEKAETMETVYGTGRMCGLKTFGIKHVLAQKAPIQVIENGKMRYAGLADMYLP